MDKEKEKKYPDIVFEISDILKNTAELANKFSLGSDFSQFISTDKYCNSYWICLIRKKTCGNSVRKLSINFNTIEPDLIHIRYYVLGQLVEKEISINEPKWEVMIETYCLSWINDLVSEINEERSE